MSSDSVGGYRGSMDAATVPPPSKVPSTSSAVSELDELRWNLEVYREWLCDRRRGPVIYRHEVRGHIQAILNGHRVSASSGVLSE